MSIVTEKPAFRTEGFLVTITRDEARESEQRSNVKKQLFRCANQANESEAFTTSPLKPVLKPTLHDHREWQGAEIENVRAIACMPKEVVSWLATSDLKGKFEDLKQVVDEQEKLKKEVDEQKKKVDEQEKKVDEQKKEVDKLNEWLGKRDATLDSLLKTYEDKQISWTVECGNRVLETLDKEVHKETSKMEEADTKMSYIMLLRSLEHNSPNENNSILAAAEEAVIDQLYHVPDFPKDRATLRLQMQKFLEVRDYRHSVSHMRYKEGGEQMLQNVSSVEKWMEQKLIPMVSTFSGVVAGGISLMRAKGDSQDTENKALSKPASPKVQGKKKQITEVVVQSTMASRLYVVQKNDPTENKMPLYVNAKGEWTTKLPRKEDVQVYYLVGVRGGSVQRGPDFAIDPEQKRCVVVWDEAGKNEDETAAVKATEMPWLGNLVTACLVSLVLFKFCSAVGGA